MEMQTIIIIIFILLSVTIVLMATSSCTYIENNYYYNPVEEKNLNEKETILLNAINNHRDSLGLKPVIAEKLASQICQDVVQLAIDNNVVSHTGFETRGEQANAKNYGEICACKLSTPQATFREYINSQKHKEIIENPKYTHVGISYIDTFTYCIFTNYKK